MDKKQKKPIFLDAASNTPLCEEARLAMKPFLKGTFVGNSHSSHSYGVKVSLEIEKARETIGNITGFAPDEIYFTSGATEGNNWVIKELALHETFMKKANPKKHIIVSAIEHNSILKTCEELKNMGFKISYAMPDKNGRITAREVKSLIQKDTLLVCVQSINNETGIRNNIGAISEITHKNRILFLCDCTQWVSYGGKQMKLKKIFPRVDYITISSHKIYGPTGVGCLFCKSGAPLYPFILGGGQERGMRGGTANTVGIIGMEAAFRFMAKNDYAAFFEKLYNYLLTKLDDSHIEYSLNAIPDHKNIVSLNFSKYFNDTELSSSYDQVDVACSAGSACDAGDENGLNKPSHVLVAMGLSNNEINNTVRLSFSRLTTKKDLDEFVKRTRQLHHIIGKRKEDIC